MRPRSRTFMRAAVSCPTSCCNVMKVSRRRGNATTASSHGTTSPNGLPAKRLARATPWTDRRRTPDADARRPNPAARAMRPRTPSVCAKRRRGIDAGAVPLGDAVMAVDFLAGPGRIPANRLQQASAWCHAGAWLSTGWSGCPHPTQYPSCMIMLLPHMPIANGEASCNQGRRDGGDV